MSDRDTYLESSLQGDDDGAHSDTETSAPGSVDLSALDKLLQGLPPIGTTEPAVPPGVSGVTTQPAEAPAPVAVAPIPAPPPGAPQAQAPALPHAAPSDILGIPDTGSGASSRFDLANEINDIAGSAPSGSAASGVASGFVSQSSMSQDVPGGGGEGWQSAPSFAAMAQEIAGTVDAPQLDSSKKAGQEPERSGVFLKTKGRRRRSRGGKSAAVLEVVGLILVLVVGLGAEYEYVARGHQPDQIVSTDITIASPAPKSAAGALPPVSQTPVANTLFHFAASGERQSAAFVVKSAFVGTWTVSCPAQAKPSAVYLLLQDSGKTAAGEYVPASRATSRHGSTAKLGPGSYVLVAKAPATCAWSFEGHASA